MRKKDEKAGFLIWILFFIYLALLVWIILFKMAFSLEGLPHIRNINLIPYGASVIVNGSLDKSELVNNIIIFLPLGLYLGMLSRRGKFWRNIAVIVGISLVLEICQYILAVGSTDITDLINNTIGGVIGLLIFFVLSKLFGKNTNKILGIIALICTILIGCFIAILNLSNL